MSFRGRHALKDRKVEQRIHVIGGAISDGPYRHGLFSDRPSASKVRKEPESAS